MSAHIGGLDAFGLTEAALTALGSKEVLLRINLRTYDVTSGVRNCAPEHRHSYLSDRAARWIKALRRRHPNLTFRVIDEEKSVRTVNRKRVFLPHSLEVRCLARHVRTIARAQGVGSVHLERVKGRRRRQRQTGSQLDWFCVRGLVAVRVEGQLSGMQTVEDRFLLVRAMTRHDAERKLEREWREYSVPYLNRFGFLVSWTLEKVVDVYEVVQEHLDPDGMEVYSSLNQRRLRPEHVWPVNSRKGV
jgi:hypothetical protein